MRIDGLVVCVGEQYVNYLKKSLPIWLDTLDSLVIVTDNAGQNNFDYYVTYHTDVFYQHGAHFNKGAALSEAFSALNPSDWVLNFDADIIPEPDWRKIAEPRLRCGNLYGATRQYENFQRDPQSTFPDLWGYFHLWNVADSHSWRRPAYAVDIGHAGNYDHTFLKHWPIENRRELPIHLIHQGEPRNNWFGEGEKARKLMANLHMLGLYEAWFTKAGHIKVPEPQRITIDKSKGADFVMEQLRKYTVRDPFKYQVTVK